MKERQNFFDVLKGIGIVYVFLGHELFYGSLGFSTIFLFHMPLFFLISGYFFNADSIGGVRELCSRFLRNLLAPSLVFLAIAAANAAAWGDLVSADHAVNVDRLKSFLRGQPYLLGSLWFVVCVFWSQLIVWSVSRIGIPFRIFRRMPLSWTDWLSARWPQVRDAALVVLMFALAHMLSKEFAEFHRDVPLKLMSVPMCVVFVTLGVLLRQWLQGFGRIRLGTAGSLVFAAVLLAVAVVAARFGRRPTNLCEVTYASTGWFILGSSAGICSSLALAKALDRGVTAVVISYVGRNSMVFFLMEGVALMNFIKVANSLGFKTVHSLLLVDSEASWGWRMTMTLAGLVMAAALPPLLNPVLRLVKRPFLSRVAKT